ncbi:YbaN family protein [Chloroflexota bacterium]
MPGKLRKRLLIILGTVCVAIGVVGIVIPVLPTTPFLLLAAACYIRSSERFYCWLVNNRFCGAYIRNYLEGRGMPFRVKVFTVLLLWAAIITSLFLAAPNLAVKIVLVVVAIGVTTHIICIKTRERE